MATINRLLMIIENTSTKSKYSMKFILTLNYSKILNVP